MFRLWSRRDQQQELQKQQDEEAELAARLAEAIAAVSTFEYNGPSRRASVASSLASSVSNSFTSRHGRFGGPPPAGLSQARLQKQDKSGTVTPSLRADSITSHALTTIEQPDATIDGVATVKRMHVSAPAVNIAVAPVQDSITTAVSELTTAVNATHVPDTSVGSVGVAPVQVATLKPWSAPAAGMFKPNLPAATGATVTTTTTSPESAVTDGASAVTASAVGLLGAGAASLGSAADSLTGAAATAPVAATRELSLDQFTRAGSATGAVNVPMAAPVPDVQGTTPAAPITPGAPTTGTAGTASLASALGAVMSGVAPASTPGTTAPGATAGTPATGEAAPAGLPAALAGLFSGTTPGATVPGATAGTPATGAAVGTAGLGVGALTTQVGTILKTAAATIDSNLATATPGATGTGGEAASAGASTGAAAYGAQLSDMLKSAAAKIDSSASSTPAVPGAAGPAPSAAVASSSAGVVGVAALGAQVSTLLKSAAATVQSSVGPTTPASGTATVDGAPAAPAASGVSGFAASLTGILNSAAKTVDTHLEKLTPNATTGQPASSTTTSQVPAPGGGVSALTSSATGLLGGGTAPDAAAVNATTTTTAPVSGGVSAVIASATGLLGTGVAPLGSAADSLTGAVTTTDAAAIDTTTITTSPESAVTDGVSAVTAFATGLLGTGAATLGSAADSLTGAVTTPDAAAIDTTTITTSPESAVTDGVSAVTASAVGLLGTGAATLGSAADSLTGAVTTPDAAAIDTTTTTTSPESAVTGGVSAVTASATGLLGTGAATLGSAADSLTGAVTTPDAAAIDNITTTIATPACAVTDGVSAVTASATGLLGTGIKQPGQTASFLSSRDAPLITVVTPAVESANMAVAPVQDSITIVPEVVTAVNTTDPVVTADGNNRQYPLNLDADDVHTVECVNTPASRGATMAAVPDMPVPGVSLVPDVGKELSAVPTATPVEGLVLHATSPAAMPAIISTPVNVNAPSAVSIPSCGQAKDLHSSSNSSCSDLPTPVALDLPPSPPTTPDDSMSSVRDGAALKTKSHVSTTPAPLTPVPVKVEAVAQQLAALAPELGKTSSSNLSVGEILSVSDPNHAAAPVAACDIMLVNRQRSTGTKALPPAAPATVVDEPSTPARGMIPPAHKATVPANVDRANAVAAAISSSTVPAVPDAMRQKVASATTKNSSNQQVKSRPGMFSCFTCFEPSSTRA